MHISNSDLIIGILIIDDADIIEMPILCKRGNTKYDRQRFPVALSNYA